MRTDVYGTRFSRAGKNRAYVGTMAVVPRIRYYCRWEGVTMPRKCSKIPFGAPELRTILRNNRDRSNSILLTIRCENAGDCNTLRRCQFFFEVACFETISNDDSPARRIVLIEVSPENESSKNREPSAVTRASARRK